MLLALPEGKQRHAILNSTARLNIYDGAVRSGKTVASILAWLDYVQSGPEGDLLMIGKTERTLLRNVLYPILDFVGENAFQVRSGAGECFIFGRRVFLAGANDEKSERKIRGMTLAGAYGDEVTIWPESMFRMTLSRMSIPGARFIGTTNADAPRHWLNVEYLEREEEFGPDHLRRFHFTLDDNPTLDPTYVEAIKREYRGLWYRRFVLGEWCVAEGAVYDMIDPLKHTIKRLPPLVRHWVGIDYGTANPTVFIMLSQGTDQKLYAHHEYRWDSQTQGRQKTDSELSKDFRRWLNERVKAHKLKPERIFYDPSAASFGLQLYRDGVPRVTPANNEVLPGIRETASLLGIGALRFHEPSTGRAFDEMVSYAWDERAQLRGEDKPVKENDHGPDALRYAIRGAWRHVRRLVEEKGNGRLGA